jgi:hypothetical protein
MPLSVTFRSLIHFYSPDHEVCDGVLLDDSELERLASWMCSRRCPSWGYPEEKRKRAEKQAAGRGYCDACEDMAGFLLAECLYINMSLPDQLVFTADGMEWRPRSADIPHNRICLPIDEPR